MNKYSQTISRSFFATVAVIFMSACDLSDGPIEEAGEELDKALEQSAAQLENAADSAEKAGSRLESTIEVPSE